MKSSPQFKRLGVYFTPPDSPLAAFGASWLGWDLTTAQPLNHPSFSGIPIPISVITSSARKYGFHATLKAPFSLAQGATLTDVDRALESLCKGMPCVRVGVLKIAALGRFLALVPKDPPSDLETLAARVVDTLDPFRAPITPEEFARKDAEYLSDRQRDNLKTYGYAYVHADFGFHMTLTDRLSKPHLAAVQDVLTEQMARLLSEPLTLDALSLVGETESGQFQLIRRYPLTP